MDACVTARGDLHRRVAQATLTFPLRRELFTLGNLQQISDVARGHGRQPRRRPGIDGALVETQ